MPYKKKRRSGIPIGIITVVCALVIGLIAVVSQYEHMQSAADEAASSVRAAQLAKKQAFINRLAPYARTLRVNYGVLPSVTLAQAILESNWGESTLSSRYHNLFGVKASSTQAGTNMTTQEYVNGTWTTVTARFRTYADDYASMREHAQLLANGTTWNKAQYAGVIAATEYKTAAKALQTAGYATDPSYATKLTTIIETYGLAKYDSTK